MIFDRRIELRFTNTYCLDPIPSSRAHSGTRRGAGAVYLSKLSGETTPPGTQSPDNSSQSLRPADQNRKTRDRLVQITPEWLEIRESVYTLNIYPSFSSCILIMHPPHPSAVSILYVCSRRMDLKRKRSKKAAAPDGVIMHGRPC